MIDMEQVIRTKLSELAPAKLIIIDDSAKHAGHQGAKPGGQTHFTLQIVSDIFINKSLIARHKIIHNLLADELRTQIHALSIKAWSIDEYQALHGK